ncbi:hypothetical protein [Maritalea sp. S77]|uniref:hypothetical protein n=1 Tax=Maritalea sp. S77 TaxID=3415125 RepID=UPI003C7BF082
MTLDGFLGFIALFVAFYAILPPVTRLRVQLHLKYQIPLAFLAILLVLYFEFFYVLGQPCYVNEPEICDLISFKKGGNFTPQQAAFLVAFCWMLLAIVLNNILKPGSNSISAIGKITQELLLTQRFAELLHFMGPNLKLIERTANRELSIQKLHDWLANRNWFTRQNVQTLRTGQSEEAKDEKTRTLEAVYEKFRHSISWTSKLVPGQYKVQAEAESILRSLLQSNELRSFITSMRPDILPDLMSIRLQSRFNFADKVMQDLISESSSRLYQEISNNENINSDFGYAIAKQNYLLSYLFSNIRTAERLAVWKPVGDYVINHIRAGSKTSYHENLNDPPDNFEETCWKDCTFVAIRFFDIMVNEAIRQGLPYHMWLMYLQHFADELVNCYTESAPGFDKHSEFPTTSARLLYEIVHVLGNWVVASKHIEQDSPHTVKQNSDETDLWIIPIGAATTIGKVFLRVAKSDEISIHFVQYLHNCILNDMSDLAQGSKIRAMLIDILLSGGNSHPDAEYMEKLRFYFYNTDHVLRDQLKDYAQRLK